MKSKSVDIYQLIAEIERLAFSAFHFDFDGTVLNENEQHLIAENSDKKK